MKAMSILKHFNILNIMLLVLILSFAYYLLLPLSSTTISVPLPAARETATDEEETDDRPGSVPSPVDFTIIAELNLFHPDRKLPEKNAEKDLPKPEFVLYGTLISDEVSFAYMDDRKIPKKTEGRQKRQTAIKVGDSLSGFVLKTVEPDKVVMSRGEDTIEVKVIDPSRPKQRETTAVASKEPQKTPEKASVQRPMSTRTRPSSQSPDDVQARRFERSSPQQERIEMLRQRGGVI